MLRLGSRIREGRKHEDVTRPDEAFRVQARGSPSHMTLLEQGHIPSRTFSCVTSDRSQVSSRLGFSVLARPERRAANSSQRMKVSLTEVGRRPQIFSFSVV